MSKDIVRRGAQLPYGKISGVGLVLPARITRRAWQEVGLALARIETGRQWWLGDWWNARRTAWGDGEKLCEEAGVDYGTARNSGAVAEAFQLSRRRDNLSFKHHAEVAGLPTGEADAWLERAESEAWSAIRLRGEIDDEARRRLGHEVGDAPKQGIQLGDFRTLASSVPNGSVSLIFTDPPYDDKSLSLYLSLLEIAARVLVRGGSLVTYCGHRLVPAVTAAKVDGLDLWWICCCLHRGALARLKLLGIVAGWKPILWFTRGTPRDCQSMILDVVSGGAEKDLHHWQQAEAEARHFIDHLTAPGDTVLDPMCGSGTTCAAAQASGRQWIGFDVDPEAVKTARERLQ